VADSVPIKSYSDEQAPWGVLKDGLQAGCFGSCIVSGPVTVTLSGEGKYAVPSESGFELADEAPEGNSALILYKNTEQAVICLGAGGGGGGLEPDWGEVVNFGFNFFYRITLDKKKANWICLMNVKHCTSSLYHQKVYAHPVKINTTPVYKKYNDIMPSYYILRYPIKFFLTRDYNIYALVNCGSDGKPMVSGFGAIIATFDEKNTCFFIDKKQIAIVFQFRTFSFIDLMSCGDNHTCLGLTEDLRQCNRWNCTATDQIGQHVPRTNAG
jgi:hypothetical protein